MVTMQYCISLPDSYDMSIIKQRVKENGKKTDGFQDLVFKVYMITTIHINKASQNEYAPLYLWSSNVGMNEFIFNGFYNNILSTFGWQHIMTGIPLHFEIRDNFRYSNYAGKLEKVIHPQKEMTIPPYTLLDLQCTGSIRFYHPDTWIYEEYYFFVDMPEIGLFDRLYTVLHISLPNS